MLTIVEEELIVLPRVQEQFSDHAFGNVPAGGALQNESSNEAALRELREETAY